MNEIDFKIVLKAMLANETEWEVPFDEKLIEALGKHINKMENDCPFKVGDIVRHRKGIIENKKVKKGIVVNAHRYFLKSEEDGQPFGIYNMKVGFFNGVGEFKIYSEDSSNMELVPFEDVTEK